MEIPRDPRIAKKLFVSDVASCLCSRSETMTFYELAEKLNRNGFTTSYGTVFAGGRGTARLVKVTYDWLFENGRRKEASDVALAFTDNEKHYAYE